VITRVLHISDLHVGVGEEPEIEAPLRSLVAQTRPDLVVASGDLTHRGRPAQHDRAAAFLRGLDLPVLAVPGNHDIPGLSPHRFLSTFREFEKRWETTEPLFSADGLYVVGLNSVRPWRHQSGGVRREQLERAAKLLRDAPPGALRAVVLHHHLTGAPWRSRKRPVSRRLHVLSALVDAGAELILSGHIHQSAISERREFEVTAGEPGATVAIAPGLGQPRPRRRGEARGLHVYEADDAEIRVETYVWGSDDFRLTASRRFPRGRGPLRTT
jgi:3',5'-cyclic AMP phosphodiesterase CpdA